MTLNMYEFPTGLSRIGNVIRLELFKIENFEDYFVPSDNSGATSVVQSNDVEPDQVSDK